MKHKSSTDIAFSLPENGAGNLEICHEFYGFNRGFFERHESSMESQICRLLKNSRETMETKRINCLINDRIKRLLGAAQLADLIRVQLMCSL